jgi:hypothetical protein
MDNLATWAVRTAREARAMQGAPMAGVVPFSAGQT